MTATEDGTTARRPRREPGNAVLYYDADAYAHGIEQIKGRHAAGAGFLDGFLRHGRVDAFHVFTIREEDAASVARRARAAGRDVPVRALGAGSLPGLQAVGAIHVPTPALGPALRARRVFGNARAFSVTGVTHTLSSIAAMQGIADLAVAPMQSWDALVCTSRAGRAAVERLLAARADALGRTGPPRIAMPVIPLGVDCDRYAETPARAAAGAALRRRLGIGPAAIVALFFGRLSVRGKAHPVPMFQAVEQARHAAGRPFHLLLCGQAGAAIVIEEIRAAARQLAPAVPVHIVDGADAETTAGAWAAADLFVSLADNVQETFGLTPVEAMAAGLPVVVSDWDGYRDTVADGETGALIPTVAPPPGAGADLAHAYAQGADSYDRFIGAASLATAVDVRACAAVLAALLGDESRRRAWGAAGRRRARTAFDWSVVIAAYQALWAELAARRRDGAERPPPHADGATRRFCLDPFTMFAGHPTRCLTDDTRLALAGDTPGPLLAALRRDPLVCHLQRAILPPAAIDVLVDRLAAGPATVASLAAGHPGERRPAALRSLGWLLKFDVARIAPAETPDT